jgi:hypothetical protein
MENQLNVMSRGCQTGAQAVPIWLAALLAASCRARSGSRRHAIEWNHSAGRATYTNDGAEAERIEPLGVSVAGGQTLVVSWQPGETAYTLEVHPDPRWVYGKQ